MITRSESVIILPICLHDSKFWSFQIFQEEYRMMRNQVSKLRKKLTFQTRKKLGKN